MRCQGGTHQRLSLRYALEPLTAEDGFRLRLIVPHLYAWPPLSNFWATKPRDSGNRTATPSTEILGKSNGSAGTSYFFRIGLYPSPTSLARAPSASLMSLNGPTCTW